MRVSGILLHIAPLLLCCLSLKHSYEASSGVVASVVKGEPADEAKGDQRQPEKDASKGDSKDSEGATKTTVRPPPTAVEIEQNVSLAAEMYRDALVAFPHPAGQLLQVLYNLASVHLPKSPISWLAANNQNAMYALKGQLILKFLLGFGLLLPSLTAMLRWQLDGHPPHPFLLSEDSTPDWPRWQHDLCQICALVGIDLMMLSLVEYDWDWSMHYLCIALFLLTLVGLGSFLYCVFNAKSSPYKVGSEFSKRCGQDSKSFEVSTQYQDVNRTLPHLMIVAVCQILLLSFYMGEMMRKVELNRSAYLFWTAAVPMQIIARTQMGRSFCAEMFFWNTMLHAKEGRMIKCGDDENATYIEINYAQLVLRAVVSFICNNLGLMLIAYTLPLFMMSSATPIDFVKDCFAVVFITTLDDCDSVTLSLANPPELQADSESPS